MISVVLILKSFKCIILQKCGGTFFSKNYFSEATSTTSTAATSCPVCSTNSPIQTTESTRGILFKAKFLSSNALLFSNEFEFMS